MKKMMLALVAISAGLFISGSAFAAHTGGTDVKKNALQVIAHINNQCFIGAVGVLDFKDIIPNTKSVVSTSIKVACTKGTRFRVGLGNGQHHTAGDAFRNMIANNLSGDLLKYTISHGSLWGSSIITGGSLGAAAGDPLGTVHPHLTGNASTTAASLPVSGTVAAMTLAQMPSAAAYEDFVTVTVYF